ncbi:phosphotransacetylase family protein [Candidatus Poribacteria bacterium]|nr:phosphotransacetylase family protein [Candidatus Poribacteria bacterium]
MKTLLISSTCDYCGKTLVCMGLGKRFQLDGFKITYMKALGRYTTKVSNNVTVDADAAFLYKILELKDEITLSSPVLLTQDLIVHAYIGKIEKNLERKIIDAHAKLADGKDIVMVGSGGDFNEGSLFDIPATKLVHSLDAQMIIIDRCAEELFVDDLLAIKEILKERVIGVILNQIHNDRLDYVHKYIVPFLNKKGLDVLGILPFDPILNSVTVGEICDKLNAYVLCCEDKLGELVESFSIGAMTVESALKYLRKRPNYAVITGGDRPEIQLAALETNAKCVILTGNLYPNDIIIARAEERGVPLLVVSEDTITTVQKVEELLGRLKIREERKVARGIDLIREQIDFQLLYEKLGISK